MMLPKFVTFTGVDSRTDLQRLANLSIRYPVEWGVLFSKSRETVENRYPHVETVWDICYLAEKNYGVEISAHICGKYADATISLSDFEYHERLFSNYMGHFKRVQINTVKDVLLDFCKNPPFHGRAKQTIVQTRYDFQYPHANNVTELYDCSGGNGLVPSAWPVHDQPHKLVGYAGGINPDNVRQTLANINCDNPYWIDMESGVRTDDWLDLDKCQSVCEQIYG